MPTTPVGFIDVDAGPIPVTQDNPLPVSASGSGPQASVESMSVAPATDAAFALKPQAGSATQRYASQAAQAAAVIFNGPGTVYGISGYNAKGSAQFIQIFDAANSVPADGAIPIFAMTVATAANFSADFGVYGIPVTQGLVISNSSTVATKTIGSADCQFYVQYKEQS